MRKLIVLTSLLLCLFWTAGAQSRSVKDGVYSKAQAGRGGATYKQACFVCHGETKTGGDSGPALSDAGFMDNWKGRTLADLYEKISTTMPASDPGSLKPDQYGDLVAFLLAENGFPAGAKDLERDANALKQIRIEPK
jgi:mono/diheme cytochrome c family protein